MDDNNARPSRVELDDRSDWEPGAEEGRQLKAIRGDDPFTSEIIRNGLAYAALEMSKGMKHAAHHPQLYEVQDFGVAIVSVDGELWGEAAGINIFLGSSAETIRNAVTFYGLDGFHNGD